MDFGLAKFQGAVVADDQTITMRLTGKGEILGTLHYMSPEQVQGKETDARSDIFSFGLVLYEMITGRCAFRAENPASLIAAILKEKPEPIEKLAPVSPPSLSRLISRALEKDPERRWQSVCDMALEIESILEAPVEASQPSKARGGFAWETAAVTLLLATAVGAWLLRSLQDTPDSTIGKTSIVPIAFEADNERIPIFSPDGKSIVYGRSVRGVFQLFVRSLPTQNSVQITEGSVSCYPVGWSPDGARVYYMGSEDLMVIGASAERRNSS